MRVAVLLKDKCQPKKCQLECINFCPPVRSGVIDTIKLGPIGKPVISEELCIGCGICVNKCPFDAIRIVNLAEEWKTHLMHQYGKNGFRLFRLPVPKPGLATGLLGPNGIGKTTCLKILAGEEIPNLGEYEKKPSWDPILDRYRGTEAAEFLTRLADGKIRTAIKPQYVDQLPKAYEGPVMDLLKKVDHGGRRDEVTALLGIERASTRDMEQLSGGELQRVAIAATLLKDAEVYFIDEPSSYLDIHERLRVARILKDLAEKKMVMVVEHDLAVMDFLCENVSLMYGSPGAYGVVVPFKGVRHAINIYLDGYLKEENVRFRDHPISFEAHPPRREQDLDPLLQFPQVTKTLDEFKLEVQEGQIRKGEVVGVLGPNATGKTTFVKILAGALEADHGRLEAEVKVSYKPQYIKADYTGTVNDLLISQAGGLLNDSFLQAEVYRPLALRDLGEKQVDKLSGGELQRVAIALCLAKEATLYLLDEPSAYLDSNQRMEAARTIRRVMEKSGKSALIVDHDVYFIDMLADALMVFGGKPGVHGVGEGPFDMRAGMNRFLKDVDVTFRRDPDTKRPRVNKPASRLDREQRQAGEYYYAAEQSSSGEATRSRETRSGEA